MERWYLDALRKFMTKRGRAPTLKELAEWLDKAISTVHSALLSLEAKGYVGRAGKTNSQTDRRFVALELTDEAHA